MTKRNSATIFQLVILFAVSLAILHGQSKQEQKSQAETMLQQMTPDQIDAKLKQYGITKEQAEAKAKELGISLDTYLNQSNQNTSETNKFSDQADFKNTLSDTLISKKQPQIKKLQPTDSIPGFTGRTGMSSTIKPFGYNIFQYPVSTFEPVINVATSPSYLLGVGDEIIINMWGETKFYFTLVINKDGNLIVPDVGPVSAIGQT
ncbi:MAG: polysaccharide biosynthesis/export family protein, partial [Bacteroidota bacterium]|nr:polysaccharide biosynthesis/export family protein [Bacteroidota bacterium]